MLTQGFPILRGGGDRTTGFLPTKTLLQTVAVNNTGWSDGVRFKVVIRDQRGLESAVEWKPEAPIPLLTSAHGLVQISFTFVGIVSRTERSKPVTSPYTASRSIHFSDPRDPKSIRSAKQLTRTPRTTLSSDKKQWNGVIRSRKKMETFWFLRLRFRRAYQWLPFTTTILILARSYKALLRLWPVTSEKLTWKEVHNNDFQKWASLLVLRDVVFVISESLW